MARFFQHIENDDNQGKVTRLLYIDDISDDEMTLYYFADGTYCNSEYVGKYDVNDVIKANCVMVELTSPTNKWKFEKHVVLPEENPMMVADDGNMYEAPLPGATGSATGQNGEITNNQKSGTRIDVRPPKIPSKFTPEDEENFLLSMHPELETDSSSEDSNIDNVFKVTNSKPVIDLPEPKENQPVMQNDVSVERFKFDDEVIPLSQTTSVSFPFMTTITFNIDEFVKNNKEITITVNGNAETITSEEFAKRLSVSSEQYEKAKSSHSNSLADEDVLIKNMIEKSKRKKCAITMRVNYELPPKEVYDTIKSVYEEGLAEQFVKGLAMRMPYDKLIASFASGLAGYYDNTLVKKDSAKTITSEIEA